MNTSTLKARIVLIIMIIAVLSYAATKAQAQQQTQPQAQQQQAKALKKDGTEAFLCGAPTKAGGKCKRHVKHAGELCFMHRGK